MKLKIYTPENLPSNGGGNMRNQKPSILFNQKPGGTSFNGALVEMLKLKHGDCVQICQDEDSPKDWYILLSESGFVLNKPKDGGKYLFFNSIPLGRKVLESLKVENQSARMIVVNEPVEIDNLTYYPIITASAK